MKLDIEFIPFPIELIDSMEFEEVDIDEKRAFVNDFVSLEERESWFQRFRGTLGKNVKDKSKQE